MGTVTRALAAAGLLLAVTYAGDSLWVWSRPAAAGHDTALGAVTFYIVAPLKNGRTEIYADQPQIEICVRALFPHRGYRPCWYADRERFHAG